MILFFAALPRSYVPGSFVLGGRGSNIHRVSMKCVYAIGAVVHTQPLACVNTVRYNGKYRIPYPKVVANQTTIRMDDTPLPGQA
jgi:hypothetical protein